MQLYHPKTTASALGGALAVIVMAEAMRAGIDITATEGASITVVLAFLCGLIAPDSDTTQTELDAAREVHFAQVAYPPSRAVAPRAPGADTPPSDTVRGMMDDLGIPSQANIKMAAETGQPLSSATATLTKSSTVAAIRAAGDRVKVAGEGSTGEVSPLPAEPRGPFPPIFPPGFDPNNMLKSPKS